MISQWKIYRKYEKIKELKNTKNFYHFFINNCESEDYKKYEQNNEKYQVKDKISNAQEKLFNGKSRINKIKIFDIVNNKELSKIIKKINNLNKKKYKVRSNYNNPTLFKKYSFIGIKFDSSSYGILAEVKFNDDILFYSLEIVWSPLDSFRGFIEYTFYLKAPISNENELLYIFKHKLENITSKDFVPFFRDSNDKNLKFFDFKWIFSNGLILICQNFITTHLYSKSGSESQLQSLTFWTLERHFDFKLYKPQFMSISCINKKENYAIETSLLEKNGDVISCDNLTPSISITKFIMEYGLKFYYLFFGYHELTMSKYRFTPFFSSLEKINYTDLHESFRLHFSLEHNHNMEEVKYKMFLNNFNKNWLCYDDKRNKVKQELFCDYKEFYRQCYEYFNTLARIQSSKNARVASIVAIIIALLGVIVSIVTIVINLLLKQQISFQC